jgi:hypothetical protein
MPRQRQIAGNLDNQRENPEEPASVADRGRPSDTMQAAGSPGILRRIMMNS